MKRLVAVVAVAAVLLASSTAFAGRRYRPRVVVHSPTVVHSYWPAGPVYTYPAPLVTAPAPVVYYHPTVVAPAPVVVHPRVYYHGRYGRHAVHWAFP